MGYRALDDETLVDYLKSRPSMQEMFSHDASFSVDEVGDGNLNLVFIVKNRNVPSQEVVVKQALPYLRVAGDSWPLTRERMRYETQALLKYDELAPGLVPKVYDADEEMSLVIMEHLGNHEIMRKPLEGRRR